MARPALVILASGVVIGTIVSPILRRLLGRADRPDAVRQLAPVIAASCAGLTAIPPFTAGRGRGRNSSVGRPLERSTLSAMLPRKRRERPRPYEARATASGLVREI